MNQTKFPQRTEGPSAPVQPSQSKICTVPECGKKHHAKGLCMLCYLRDRFRKNKSLRCSVLECERRRYGHYKFCYQHSPCRVFLRESIKEEIKRQIELVLPLLLQNVKDQAEIPSANTKEINGKRPKNTEDRSKSKRTPTSAEKNPSDKSVEYAVERFQRSLSLNNPAAALRIIEDFYRRYPAEKTAPYEIALKHHEKFHTTEFKKQMFGAVERGRARAKQSSVQSNEVQEGV